MGRGTKSADITEMEELEELKTNRADLALGEIRGQTKKVEIKQMKVLVFSE